MDTKIETKNHVDNRAMLGELFYRASLIRMEHLADALFVAHRNKLPLGRVMVMLGMIRHRWLEQALDLQNLVRQNILAEKLAPKALEICVLNQKSVAEALKDLGWEGDPARNTANLGDILVEAKLLSAKTIEDTRGLCKHVGLPLSRVLILQGLIDQRVLEATLSAQTLLRQGRCDKKEVLAALSSAAHLIDCEKALAVQEDPTPFLRLDELLLLAGLLTEREQSLFENFEKFDEKSGRPVPLGEFIVESGMYSASLISAAVRLQHMLARHELNPACAARSLGLVFSQTLSLSKAIQEASAIPDLFDGSLSFYNLLRLSGLVTAFDIRRLGHLPRHIETSELVEDRLVKTGILSRSAYEATKRCHLLMKEGFISAEQAVIVLHHWSWSGEGLTRVLQNLRWDGGELPTLKAMAFRA
ncbi:MAG: hypothetical protein KGS72_02650 [Cyanobacteria bacterium REEB67]|nr:hypothetical protein [Cyanobacteria bacterium REEB67]